MQFVILLKPIFNHIYEVGSKKPVIFKFRELRMFDFRIFVFCFVGTYVCYICWQYQPFWIFSLFLTDKSVSRIFVCSSIFYYLKKWKKETIKFCVKDEIKCSRTFEMLTATFDESTMRRSQVQLWYNRIKECREDVNDDTRPGRPSMSTTDENIEALKKMILDNRWITIREVADDVIISFGSCQVIFTDVLGVKRPAANIVPKLLNLEQNHVAWTSLRRCRRRSTII